MKVAELTTEELKTLIRDTVAESLADLLGDPDEGLELRDTVRKQLLHQKSAVAAGERGEAFEDVVKSLGLS